MAAVRKKMKSEIKRKKGEGGTEAANDETLLKERVDSVDEWYTYSNEHIERARNYLSFLYVDQWEMTIRNTRESLSRPCMQFNKVTPIIRAILGEQRENSPALTVRGVGKNVRQQEVDLRDGLMRQIHYSSDADIIYQVASKSALECGWGAVRVCTKYESVDSFDQCIYLEPVVDFQCAFWDPVAQLPDKSDGDYCGIYTTISKKHFKRIYPKVKNPEGIEPSGDSYYFRWSTVDTITICEQYYKEYFAKKMVQLSDGKTFEEKEANEILERQQAYLDANPDALMMGFSPLEVTNEKEEQDYKIKYVKFIKNQILEKQDWPGKLLPIVYFEGDSVVIDGERIPIPYIQDAIDNQRLVNYLGSELAYAVLRSRKETVMGTPKNFKGFEQIWRNPDQVQGTLKYNWDDKAGKPEFIKPPVFSGDMIELYQNASNDLQQNLGWFEEAKGNETNADSGKAINLRQQASKKPVNVYQDNITRGIKQCGKVILDLIPHIYDNQRTVMIRSQDNNIKAADINQPNGFSMLPNGEIEQRVQNDMSYGKYDIEVRVDGSYDAQMAGAMDMLIRLAQINPGIANLIPDLMAEVSGLENTQKLVNRLKTLLPPQILAEEEGKPMPPPKSPPPDPMVEVQHEKNQVAMAQNETRQKQLALDEQKIMLQAHLAGVEQETTYAKANAEIQKSLIDKDAALINHVTKIAEHHKPVSNNNRG